MSSDKNAENSGSTNIVWHHDLVVDTGTLELQEGVQQVIAKMIGNGILSANEACQDNYL